LLPAEQAPEDVHKREEQTGGERERSYREEHGDMKRNFSQSGGEASEAEAEKGKEIQSKGKACPFF
jgi:hypothetical protein